MAGGFIAEPYPGIDEHEAIVVEQRRRIEALRRENEYHERQHRRLARSSSTHIVNAKKTQEMIVDLGDRAKFVRIAHAASQVPTDGPAPHEFYQLQSNKLRERSLGMLAAEAEDFGTDGQGGGAYLKTGKVTKGPVRKARNVPANFSPCMGLTRNSIVRMDHPTLIGLRNLSHWQSSKRPGRVPALLPRDSPDPSHHFNTHHAAYRSRAGTLDHSGFSRAYVSEMTRCRSSPGF